jgi:GDP-L-fucose synthase
MRILRDEFGVDVVYGILTNLFGPNDRFKGRHTHVIPALIHRASHAHLQDDKSLEVWGFPTTTRDFLHCDEAAKIIVALISSSTLNLQSFFVNIGSGIETSMRMVADIISKEFEIERLIWRHEKPVGVQHRYLDISKLTQLGIENTYNFENDLIATIDWYKANSESLR